MKDQVYIKGVSISPEEKSLQHLRTGKKIIFQQFLSY